MSKGGYKDEDISSIFKRLYNKTYCSQTISNWEKEKSSPEELAKEINALWTYQPSVDSEKDREKCDFVKVLLKDCGFEVQNDNNIIYNTNCQRNMTNNQANVQLQENNVYIDNVQNDYINNNVTGIEIKQNDRVILPALDSLLKTIESNNNINNDQNDYMNNNVIEFEQDNNNFNNNWNYNSGTSCNNSDQTIFSKQINMSDNSNYPQEMINNQINTQSKEDGGYIDNEYVETGDEYNLLEFEEETGFMQNRYYSNYEF